MTRKEQLVTAVVIALIALAGFLAVTYVQEREDRIRAQMESQAIQREVKAKDDGRKERDAAAEEKIADLKERAAKVRTVPQAVAAMSSVLPQLPSPIVEYRDPNLPDAPSQALIPHDSVVPLYKHLAQCQQDAIALDTCAKDLKDADATRVLLEKDRDVWKAATNGGTKWRRVKRAGKWFGIGAAVGGTVTVILLKRKK